MKALSKAQAEIQLWKSKFETDGLGRIDELESNKLKLVARLTEAEETIDSLNQKIATTEKVRHRLDGELEELQLEYERVHAAAIITEKRGRNFDKVMLQCRMLFGILIHIMEKQGAGRMKIWQVIVKYPSKTISIPNIFGEMVPHGFQNSITFK